MRDILAKTSRLGAATALSLLLSRAIGFVLMPFLTRALPQADYGILDNYALLGQVFALIAAQGMPSALFREYAYSAKTEADRQRAIATVFRYTAASSIVFAIVLSLAAWPLAGLVAGESAKRYAVLVILVLLTYAFSNMKNTCAQILRADFRSREFLIVYCGEFVICVGLNIWFVLVQQTGLAGIVYSNLIGAAMAFLLALYFVPQGLSRATDRSRLPNMLRFALPLVPPALLVLMLDAFDKVFFRLLLPHDRAFETIGVFGRGATIAQILQGVLIMPLNLLWPGIYYDVGKRVTRASDLGRCASWYAAAAGFLACGLAVTSQPLVALMTDVRYHVAWRVVPPLAFALAFVGAAEITKAGMLIHGTTRPLPRLMAIAVAASIVLNLLLIPVLGMLGPAFAALGAYALLAVLHGLESQKHVRTDYEWSRLFRVGVAIAVALVAGFAIPYPDAASATVARKIGDLLARGGAVLVLYPLVLFVTGWFTSGERDVLRRVTERFARRAP